ncbi:MAG: PHB depolymerase family esterase [Chloroflexota bacterium]
MNARRKRAKFGLPVDVHGMQRTYVLYVPTGYDAAKGAHLVIALHGGGSQGGAMRALSKFDALAEQENFIVVYPDALLRNWNDDRSSEKLRSDADDVAFISALIDHLAKTYTIQKVFATGISNGGFMTFRLACELADKISAFAAVAATMPADSQQTCQPGRAVPMLVMNGTDDRVVPYEGGQVMGGRGDILSTEATVAFWAANNGCSGNPVETLLPDLNPRDQTRVYVRTYPNGSAPVVLYRIENGGHTWPGGAQYLPVRMIGRVSRGINATQVIWDFFKAQV